MIALVLAIAAGAVPYALGAWNRLETASVQARFALRGPERPAGVVVVGIDSRTFDALRLQWPFPRRLEAEVIDTLKADGARAIALDIQFTEPTDQRDDDALYDAVARAGHVVLATTETTGNGQTAVFGGNAAVRAADAVVASANLPEDASGLVSAYPYRLLGLPSFAAAIAAVAGDPVPAARFHRDRALIDFRGPARTIPEYPFSSVLADAVSRAAFAGKVVVVGAVAPTLGDLHATPTGPAAMTGPELQADAIWTALHGNPLQPAPGWLAIAMLAVCAAAAPVASLRSSVSGAAAAGLAVTAAYLGFAQVAFDAGTLVNVTGPAIAGVIGCVTTLAARYRLARSERNAFARMLDQSQLELIQRLAQAVEWRDSETGEHTVRIGKLSRALALELGWSSREACELMHAAAAHDIGKIGVPDAILLKPGRLEPEEYTAIQQHTTIGASMLAGSANPILRLAEVIARSHHERWDGTGYPDGLAGEEIPLAARICAVVDVYDALTSGRPYKAAWPAADALAELQRCAGTMFDPALVRAFVALAARLDGERPRAEPLRPVSRDERGTTAAVPAR